MSSHELLWRLSNNFAKTLISSINGSFDDNLIFNNCSQSGKANIINNNFPDELKKSYEYRITHLEKEVLFLRELLTKR